MNPRRVEAELKYLADDERPLAGLEFAPTLGPALLGTPRQVTEVDRYLDTPDRRLAAVRWACRLRTRDGLTIVSLKGPAKHLRGELLHLRPEVEGPAESGLDPAAWPPSPARDQLLATIDGAHLEERFRLDQRRTERDVTLNGGRIGRLSLDRVTVLHGGVEMGRLLAVELEFEPAVMDELDHRPLATALGQLPGLTPDPMSKFERALAMLPTA